MAEPYVYRFIDPPPENGRCFNFAVFIAMLLWTVDIPFGKARKRPNSVVSGFSGCIRRKRR